MTMTVKETVEKIIHDLPSDATLEDINYHLYVYEKIQKADESERLFGLVSNDEAKERIRKCLAK
jgi:hypothetical protein